MASEKKQRCLSKELITTRIAAEIASFTHPLRSGEQDAMAYIPYLPVLDQQSRYSSQSIELRYIIMQPQ